MGGRKDKCGKHKSKKTKASAQETPAKKLAKDRTRAYFLEGSTGPWAKTLAAQDDDVKAQDDAKAETPEPGPHHRGPDYSVPSSIDIVADPVLHAMSTRRSISKVEAETPNDSDLLEIIRSISSVADHKGLRPWRFLIIRGDDRHRLGEALDEAGGVTRKPGEVNEKPLRAELLLALVSSPEAHPKVPEWEQHATAAGAGHLLELALWQSGWGVMWRSGTLANTPPVRRLHRLAENELLMGWFYIGAVSDRYRQRLSTSTRPLPTPEQFLDTL